jgi:hypothetical protein
LDTVCRECPTHIGRISLAVLRRSILFFLHQSSGMITRATGRKDLARRGSRFRQGRSRIRTRSETPQSLAKPFPPTSPASLLVRFCKWGACDRELRLRYCLGLGVLDLSRGALERSTSRRVYSVRTPASLRGTTTASWHYDSFEALRHSPSAYRSKSTLGGNASNAPHVE